MNIAPRLLQSFLALAHCRNFTEAATRMHMSQSAFSQAIARLESQVGVKLFDRSTRSVSLTPEGHILVPMATRLERDIALMFQELHDHADRKKGKVAIAAPPGASADWLPRVMANFRHRYPGIQLQLHDTYSDRILELVRNGTVDFALNREIERPEEFDVCKLFDDPHYLVCPQDHPLAREKSIRVAQLAGENYIHLLRGSSLWQRLYPHLSRVAIRDTGFELNNMSTAAGLIANGMGVTIVAGQSLFNYQRLGLAAVLVSDTELRNSGLYLLKRRGQSLSVAAQGLREMIEADKPVLPATQRPAARRQGRTRAG